MNNLYPWFNKYPYVNDEQLNLDWILRTIKKLTEELTNFINLNTIKYADPILWDITKQYEANTIVVDPQTGDAYISTKAVPYGVSLSNTDYWTKIYNYADAINTLEEQIAAANEELSTTASAPRAVGDLVWLNGLLYKIISPMIAGDSYVVGSNCIKTTIEEEINLVSTNLSSKIGDLDNLTTTDKSNLVAAINEVLTSLIFITGDLDNLITTDKSNLVAAINEVLTTLLASTGDLDNLTTSDKSNLVAAINELVTNLSSIINNTSIYNVKNYGAVGDGVTDDTVAINDCITAAGTNGTIYFPLGEYKTTNFNIDSLRILMAPGTIISDGNETSETKYFARPEANSFNQTVGELSKLTCDIVTVPRSAECLVSHDILGDLIVDFTTTGSIANGSNVITVADASGIKEGDGVLCSAAGWLTGDNIANTMRVISISGNNITVGADNGEGAGVGDNTWTWTGSSISGQTFTFRHRSWTCSMFLGNTSAHDTNIDRINWGLNVVGVSHGEPLIVQEIDTIAQTKRVDGGYQTGLLVTGQNNANENTIGAHVTMGGLYPGGIGVEVARHVIGAKLSALTEIVLAKEFYNNTNQQNELVAGQIVSEDYGEYISVRPNLALKQLANGAVMQTMKRNTDSTPSGYFARYLSADGLTELASIGIDGSVNGNWVVTDKLKINIPFGSGTPVNTKFFRVYDQNGDSYLVGCQPE